MIGVKVRMGNYKIKKMDIILFLFSFAIFSIDYISQIKNDGNIIIYITFGLIGLFSLVELCLLEHFISVIKVFFSFIFVFFYCAPIHQYNSGRTFWGLARISDNDYIFANLLILLSMSLIIIFYRLTSKSKIKKRVNPQSQISVNCYLVFLIIDLLCLAYFIAINGIFTFSSSSSDTIFSSVQKIIRFFPVATLLIGKNFEFHNNTKIKICFSLNCLIVFILFFPLAGAVSRFLLFATYLMLFADKLIKIKYKFLLPIALLVGFTVVFPIFNFFKTNTISNIFDITLVVDSFNTVDFDAYQMFIYSIKYVNESGMLFGKNLLTALLFFIPRSIWNQKLHHSGELVSTYFNGYFNNLSCPYIGELYLAMGLAGIIFGSIVLGRIFKKFDSVFLDKTNQNSLYVTIVFGMSIYLLRGALLPTFAYTMALLISQYIAIKIKNQFKNIDSKK